MEGFNIAKYMLMCIICFKNSFSYKILTQFYLFMPGMVEIPAILLVCSPVAIIENSSRIERDRDN